MKLWGKDLSGSCASDYYYFIIIIMFACWKKVLREAMKVFNYCIGELANFTHWNNPLKENLFPYKEFEKVNYSWQQAEDLTCFV